MLPVIVYMFFALIAQADESQVLHLFQSGNQAYQQGDYDKAITDYEEALEIGYANASLYYNLGNAYFKKNEIGKAILYYERAKKLAPRDPDIQFNLDIANLYVVDKITAIPPHIFARVWQFLKNLISLSQLAVLLAVIYAVTILLWIGRLLLRKPALHRWSSWLFVPFLILTILTSLFFLTRLNSETKARTGIIMVAKVEVRNSPSEDASEAFALHEGTKVNILDSSGAYYKISIADGNIGWLPQDAIEII